MNTPSGLDRFFTYVQVFPDFNSGHKISWGLNPTLKKEKLQGIQYKVECQMTTQFEELVWYSEWTSETYVVDNTCLAKNKSWTDDMYYRVRQRNSSGKEWVSHCVILSLTSRTGFKQRLVSELNRCKLVQIRMGGRPQYFLKRKVVQETDPEAVDPVTGAPLDGEDSTYGTGKYGGYYSPISIGFVPVNRRESRQVNDQGDGVDEEYVLSGTMLGFPIIQRYDVIVDILSGRRYFIDQKEVTYMPGTNLLISQTFVSRLIPTGSQEYNIPVPD